VRELDDILVLPPPPHRDPLPIRDPLDGIVRAYAQVDPFRVVGVVNTNEPDGGRVLAEPDKASQRIAEHVVEFFLREIHAGRIPLIENCAHPAYRDALHRYLEGAPIGHIRHDLRRCFEMHLNYLEHGAMLPEPDLSQLEPRPAAGPA
jgi:acyl-CoA hydrolase